MKKLIIDCSATTPAPQVTDMTAEEITAMEEQAAIDVAAALKTQALSALAETDLVAIRCFKDGIAFPETWRDYVADLRDIVNGGAGPLPEQPAYPGE